jgi:hypothetical protein
MFTDDGGPFNPLGATLFWALWGERHDTARLEANLSILAAAGVDYVRILGMVGAASWEDRIIDPRAPDYGDVADRLLRRLARHGLRAQVTVFADAQVMMPAAADRRAFADAWVARANRNRDRVFALEVANEGWQNGFEPDEMRGLGRRMADATAVPVALSSAPDGPGEWCRLYSGSGVDFATVHYDRDISGADGQWRPVWQPWGYPGAFDGSAATPAPEWACPGRLPPVAANNEPIGPFSSVAEDRDPVRLALAYVTTFVSGNGAHVFHASPGVRGGGAVDVARGRAASYGDLNPAILASLSAMRRLLPPGLAGWRRHDAQSEAMPFAGFAEAIVRGDLLRAFAATSPDGELVAVLLGIRRPMEVVARSAMELRAVLADGRTIARATLAAGDRWRVPANAPGLVLIGRRRPDAPAGAR